MFTILGPFAQKPDAAAIAKVINSDTNAIDVYDVREVVLAEDDKGIAIRLSEGDTRTMKRMLEKGGGRWFAATAPPKDFIEVNHPSLLVQ